MTTATQQLERVNTQSIAASDMRYRQEMTLANDAFVRALDRYFLARDMWGK